MGNRGGNNRLSDEQKKKNGTFKESRSEAVYAARAAEKVITGPWLTEVKDPETPLGDVGRRKFFEFANLLLKGNKLTQVTRDDCERYAVLWEQMHEARAAGRVVSMATINRMDSIAVRLRIADDAPAIASPNEKNRFAGSGFSNIRSSPIRLRTPRASGTGEL